MTQIQRRYTRLIDAARLTPEIIALHTESQTLVGRYGDAHQALTELLDTRRDEEAATADRNAAAIAIRKGKTAASAGTPAQDQLAKDRNALTVEVNALGTAIVQIEDQMQTCFEAMRDDPKLSGRAALDASIVKYRAALAGVLTARAEFISARLAHQFIQAASEGETAQRLNQIFNAAAMAAVPVNTISTNGERDAQMRPVSAEHLLEQTFAREMEI